ncbi:hypothetical protein FPJ27_11985 [Burkholderia sp. MS455]|nr:hypothetical protein FPJ27_11985 [Burkholderia sp. MS455]
MCRKGRARARPFRCGIAYRAAPAGARMRPRLSRPRKKCGETGRVATFFLLCLQRRGDSVFRSQHSFTWRTTGLRTCIASTEPNLSRRCSRISTCR